MLRDADGAEVARGAGASGTLTVPDVHKWAPGDGYLYDLELQLTKDGELVDSYHQSVGVRTVRVDGARFLINDEPFYFTGFGKHEDIPVIGKGHNNAYLLHDFELLRWIGANSFRTSHYPYAEDVLDYADRQGIVLIDETAAVGLNMGLGGGIFGGQGYTTFSPETANDETQEVHAQAIRDLIARDKNHPSVVLWSIANEPESETEAAENYFRPALRRGPGGRPDPPGRLRQRDAGPAREVPGLAVRRRVDAEPLLRLVRADRGPRRRRGGLGGRADRPGPARTSRSSSPSTAPTPTPACTRWWPTARGPRSTRWSTWT